METGMIGAYGAWSASLYSEKPGRLSLRACPDLSLDEWRQAARTRTLELLAEPAMAGLPAVTVHDQWHHEGLLIEDLSWQLPAGPPTRAFFLRPADARQPLPGILALHDHGGKKTWGRSKLVETPVHPLPPLMHAHRAYYGGRAWANVLAQAGFAVLVHDAFAFASRRVRLDEVPELVRGGTAETPLETREQIEAYNRWAARHETVMAKSLFAAGITWPGVVLYEDRVALDILCARPDVDAARIGCGGLSGGGLRTVYLAGLDDRIQAAVCAGMMTTWRDFILHSSIQHTWMAFAPLLAQELDYPEILGLRVPKPTLVLNCNADPLFTLAEMKRADAQLAEVFRLAGHPENYVCRFLEGGHKFDREMQEIAHAFLRHHLQA